MTTSVVNLVTGLQGAGKTLYTITAVKEQAEKENRQVYYHGIKELMLPWTLLDKPQDWPSVPTGSIVVIDESQELYRSRPAGSAVPAWVSALETLRHRGITLWLITQHPMLLDNHVRRLCGRHLHAIRRFGGQSANVHEFNAVREGVDKPGGRKDSILHVFKYPKAHFGLYKSAEVHTVKRSIPKRAVVLLLFPVALGGIGWILYKNFYGNRVSEATQPAAGVGAMPAGRGVGTASDGGHVKTAEEYIAGYQARIPGLDYTAPIYDDLTKPKRVPVPAACVTVKGLCQCYTQQGTKLQVKADQCAQIVRDGFFLAFDPDGEQSAKATPVAASPAPAPVSAPTPAPEPQQQQPQVVVVNDFGRGQRARLQSELEVFDDSDPTVKRLVRR